MTEQPQTPSTELDTPATALPPATSLGARAGMWSQGTGDTSGYGGMVRDQRMPGPVARPYGAWFDAAVDRLIELVPGADFSRVIVYRDELTIVVDRSAVQQVMQVLRDDAYLRFEICMSVSGVHYPHDTDAELHVVYQLLSITHNRRVRIEVSCPEQDPHVPSVVRTYPMADYHERETWDMFGIQFDGHPALTRILMPDDWVGHPQRKDYPLGGIPIEYKGAQVPPPDQRRKYNA